MASEVHELLVRLRPEGAAETREELEQTTDQFEASAEQTEEAAGVMSDFSSKFKGSMQVVVAGLAVASAGLLTQVPVIGEAASGLFAVIDALAFKMDSVLRPVLTPVTEGLFELADAINESNGPFGTFLGIIGSVLAVLGLAEAAVIGLNAAFGLSLTGPVAAIVGFLGGPVTLAILAIVALIGLLALAWERNWFDIRGKAAAAKEFLVNIFGSLKNAAVVAWGILMDILTGRWGEAAATIIAIAQRVFTEYRAEILSFIGDALKFVTQFFNEWITRQQLKFAILRTGFETLFDLLINGAKSFANTFVGIIERAVNEAIMAVPSMIRAELGLSTVSLGKPFNPQSTSEVLSSGRERLASRTSAIREQSRTRQDATERQIDRLIQAMQNTDQTFSVSLDSREVAEETKPFMDSGTTTRGR